MNLKDVFRTLASNVHVLLISLLIASLSFGMMASSPGSSQSFKKGSTKGPQTFELSTSPQTSPNSGGSNIDGSTPNNAPSAPAEAQNEPEQTTSSSASPEPSQTTPKTPNITCTPCIGDYGCGSFCRAPVSPTPPPPTTGCGVCGGYATPPNRHMDVMCPMFCDQTTPIPENQ